jgi:hypothetical protein
LTDLILYVIKLVDAEMLDVDPVVLLGGSGPAVVSLDSLRILLLRKAGLADAPTRAHRRFLYVFGGG